MPGTTAAILTPTECEAKMKDSKSKKYCNYVAVLSVSPTRSNKPIDSHLPESLSLLFFVSKNILGFFFFFFFFFFLMAMLYSIITMILKHSGSHRYLNI